MSLPSTMKALKTAGKGNTKIVDNAPVPSLDTHPSYILAKVSHVAINPTDWKHVAGAEAHDHTVGCDWSGTVAAIGRDVKKPLKVGDRVSGFCHGVRSDDPQLGAFGQYAISKGDIVSRLAPNVSFESASTLGVGISTVGQGLYQSLGLKLPVIQSDGSVKGSGEGKPVLIYGASTATGILAVQYAKLSGYAPVAICSQRNFELVKSLGAVAAFDYKDPAGCAKSIRDYTNNSLLYAFDCISEGTSPEICANSLTSATGSTYSALLPFGDFLRKDVESKWTLGYTINGEAFSFRSNPVPAKPEDFEFGVMFWELAEKLLEAGKLRTAPERLNDGGKGLKGVQHGLEELKQGRVSGEKLVYEMDA